MIISTPTDALSDTNTVILAFFLHCQLFKLLYIRCVFYKQHMLHTISCSVWQLVFSFSNLGCNYLLTDIFAPLSDFLLSISPHFFYAVTFFFNDGDILVGFVFSSSIYHPTHHRLVSYALFFPILFRASAWMVNTYNYLAAKITISFPFSTKLWFQNTWILIASLLTYMMSLSDILGITFLRSQLHGIIIPTPMTTI